MKKVFAIISVIAMFTACNFTQSSNVCESDSTVVDSAKVDSSVVTFIVVDTVIVK